MVQAAKAPITAQTIMPMRVVGAVSGARITLGARRAYVESATLEQWQALGPSLWMAVSCQARNSNVKYKWVLRGVATGCFTIREFGSILFPYA